MINFTLGTVEANVNMHGKTSIHYLSNNVNVKMFTIPVYIVSEEFEKKIK